MARTLVRNQSDRPLTLPLPYGRTVKPGASGVIADTPVNVLAALGGSAAIEGLWTLTECLDANAATITPLSTADIADASVTTPKLAAGAVTKAKQALFMSAVLTGNGGAQSTAHGLGAVPSTVFIALVGGPGAFTQPTIVEGAHDGTNIVATVTTNWQYRILAWV